MIITRIILVFAITCFVLTAGIYWGRHIAEIQLSTPVNSCPIRMRALEGCEDAVHIASEDSDQYRWMYTGCFNRLKTCLEFNGQLKEEPTE